MAKKIIRSVPTARLDQLTQLTTATWDGDLISKADRDSLVKDGLAIRKSGWNIISGKGIELLNLINVLSS